MTPPLRTYAQIFVLAVVARLDGLLPFDLVVVERRALPRHVIGFSLVFALLVDGHVGLFAATGKTGRGNERGKQCRADASHDFAPGCGGRCVSGLLYAVPQPHTSDPRPRV